MSLCIYVFLKQLYFSLSIRGMESPANDDRKNTKDLYKHIFFFSKLFQHKCCPNIKFSCLLAEGRNSGQCMLGWPGDPVLLTRRPHRPLPAHQVPGGRDTHTYTTGVFGLADVTVSGAKYLQLFPINKNHPSLMF